LESPYNIFATAEASDFKTVRQVGYAKAITKFHQKKSGRGSFLIFLQRLKRLQIWYAAWVCQDLLQNHTQRKSGLAMGKGSIPKFGVPL